MKKQAFTFLFVMLAYASLGQQWVAIKSDVPSTIQTQLVSSSENQTIVNLQVGGFYAFEVNTPRGMANIVSVPRTVSTAQAGEPNLPMIAIPVLIGDHQHYGIRVIDTQYTDFQMEIAPSKGDFPRSINVDDVPYTYGKAYSTDAFFPSERVGLYEPYILRDFRGQNMVVFPFSYNPITHTLRVYYNMTIEMFSDGIDSQNAIERRSNGISMDAEIRALYTNHFINYETALSKYTPVDETGHLLIICHDAFMQAMQPFVAWKKQIGRPTTMVGTSTAGTTYTAIKNYIQSQYNANNQITHVLLVGDVAQIPGNPYSAGSYGGKSDNMYGQIVGNDLYNDLIVGRFSAENATQVTTQVNKVIHYERDITTSDTWLCVGQGVSKNEGAGSGHYGESDHQHIDNIRNDLLAYNYNTVHRDYQGVSGVTSSAAIISQHINEGLSIINYCNHGSETSWGVFGYSNSHVNALTNDNKLPIIWSVACLNGKYDHGQPCFAEAWLRATNNVNGTPTGAIGGMFSYISQPWQPPQYAQDEMVDVLVESYSGNIKRTLGGCSYDGNMKILDQYGSSNNSAKGTYLSWILFGDPTLTLRNAIPIDMGVTHAASMEPDASSFTVTATNGNGALATLTLDNEILGSATITNGTANITFASPVPTGTATLTVFGYNRVTYIATVEIIQSDPTYHYEYNPYLYPDNMSITGIIQIEGEEQYDPNLEVGAFCGDECRGTVRPTYIASLNRYMLFMTVFGTNGDEIDFRLYNHASGEESEKVCQTTLTFEVNAVYGDILNPYVFNFVDESTTQTTVFQQGWNWWSSFVELGDIDGLYLLEEELGQNGLMVKSQNNGFVSYLPGFGWYGSLSTIDNESTYQVNMSNDCSVEFTGLTTNPANHPITLHSGWTWIGYPANTEMSVAEALSSIEPQNGDMLKSQNNGYASYLDGFGWYGSLNMLTPGMGLMYMSNNNSDVTLTYPSGGNRSDLKANQTTKNNHWQPNLNAYADNMNVMAVVELDGEELQGEQYELAAFANGEVRGSARLLYVEPIHRYMAFLTVAGDETTELHFGLYNTETGRVEMQCNASLQYETNAIVGSFAEPYVVGFRSTTGTDEWSNATQIYPNPVEHGQMLSFAFEEKTVCEAQVDIINAMGAVVDTRKMTSLQTNLFAPTVAGIYTLRITEKGKGVSYIRLIVK